MQRDVRSREEKRQAVANDGVKRRTLSFYKYTRFHDPKATQKELQKVWGDLGCLGRIYVASEGINAQMNVPEANWEAFDAFMKSREDFADIPYKFAVEEGSESSFYKLTIKLKDKIVADGLDDDSFDVTNTGEYLTAKEMNDYIDDPEAVIIDMRNNYESEVGHFEGAVLPDVETFRDELKEVPKKYKIHQNKKIALYCTGGIRCEKASAWLKHNGFKNVKHLKGGIIDYKHQVEQEGLENKFHGKNFVFDERLGERISDEIISTCHLCNETKSDTHYHCKFEPCHVLFIGCDACIEKKVGYCSFACKTLDRLSPLMKRRYARLRSLLPRQQFKKTPLRKR